jgi:hypothetical protein
MFTHTSTTYGVHRYQFKNKLDRLSKRIETSIDPETCGIYLTKDIQYYHVRVKNMDKSKSIVQVKSEPLFYRKTHRITVENGQIQYNPPLKEELDCYYRYDASLYKKSTTTTIQFVFSDDNNEGAEINQATRSLVETVQENIYDDIVVSTKCKASLNEVDDILHALEAKGHANIILVPSIASSGAEKQIYANYTVWLKNDQKNDQKNDDEKDDQNVDVVVAQEIVVATDVTVCK